MCKCFDCEETFWVSCTHHPVTVLADVAPRAAGQLITVCPLHALKDGGIVQVFCVWLTPNQDLAYVLATGYVAASILLSGFYLRIDDMKLAVMRGLSYLSYTKCVPQSVAAQCCRCRHGKVQSMPEEYASLQEFLRSDACFVCASDLSWVDQDKQAATSCTGLFLVLLWMYVMYRTISSNLRYC